MNKMNLYHGSVDKYASNEIIGPFVKNRCSERIKKPNGSLSGDDILESCRPRTKFSRIDSVFALDRPEYCYEYIRADSKYLLEESSPLINIYEVVMDSSTACPMALVNLIKDGENHYLINEYWEPRLTWNFLEYLAPTMQIVRRLDEPNIIEICEARTKYNLDIKQGKKLMETITTETRK